MARTMRNVALIITGLFALGFLIAVSVNTPGANAAGRMPPEADEGNSSMAVKSVVVGYGVGASAHNQLIRTDDWERGVSCYSTSADRVMSCVPMSPKTAEQRP